MSPSRTSKCPLLPGPLRTACHSAGAGQAETRATRLRISRPEFIADDVQDVLIRLRAWTEGRVTPASGFVVLRPHRTDGFMSRACYEITVIPLADARSTAPMLANSRVTGGPTYQAAGDESLTTCLPDEDELLSVRGHVVFGEPRRLVGKVSLHPRHGEQPPHDAGSELSFRGDLHRHRRIGHRVEELLSIGAPSRAAASSAPSVRELARDLPPLCRILRLIK
jgi:hypothetical protein